jgi:hypothetical protein
MKPKFGFLMSEAGELASGGGNAPVVAAAAVVAASGSDGKQGNDAPVPRELSFVEKVAASFQSKGALAADLQAATQRAESAEKQLLEVQSEFATVKAERDGLAKEKQEIADLLKGAQEQAKTVTQESVEQVAQLGFTAAEAQALPGAQEQTESPIKQLEKEYAATSCPKEKGKIAAKMVEAMKAEA